MEYAIRKPSEGPIPSLALHHSPVLPQQEKIAKAVSTIATNLIGGLQVFLSQRVEPMSLNMKLGRLQKSQAFRGQEQQSTPN